MNLKKVAASFTAIACCAGILSYFPQINEKTFAAQIVYN